MPKKQKNRKKIPWLIVPHAFTGKRLPRHHTSYPILLFVLLLCGVLLAGLTLGAQAADLTVVASVDGPPPVPPAVITSPTTGTHFAAKPIDVSGTCPPGGMVNLYRNNVLTGSTLCDINNQFTVQTDLFSGQNDLKAVDYDSNNVIGPPSNIVTVYYDAPIPPTTTTTPANQGQSTNVSPSSELVITTDNQYKSYTVGSTVSWQIDINGGRAPYTMNVDWGDGKTSNYFFPQAETVTIFHQYDKAGGYKGSIPIKITIRDVLGTKTFLNLFTIITATKPIGNVIPTGPNLGNVPSAVGRQIARSWYVYGFVLLMVGSFWLGEWEAWREAKHVIIRRPHRRV